MKLARTSNRSVRRKFWLAVLSLAGCLLFGCGSDEPSAEERLLKRQLDREIKQATKPKTFDEKLSAAEREFELQNYGDVKELTRELLADRPNDSRTFVLAAQAEKALGDLEAATELLDAVPGDADQWPAAMRVASKWLAAAGEYDEAIVRLTRLQESERAKRRDLHQLAALLNNAGRRVEAAKVLDQLLPTGDITEKELFSLITLGSPFIDSTRPKPNFDKKLIPAALAQARMLREDDANEAKRLAKRLFDHYSLSTQIYAFLGRLYAELHDWESLGALLRSRPNGFEVEPEFWFAIGMLLQQQDEHRKAAGCFREAISLDPTDRFSYQQLSRSLRVLDQQTLSEQMMHRHQLLDESSRLIRKIGIASGTDDQLSRLAEILDEMHRPLEAIAWRLVASRQRGALPSDIERLARLRVETLNQGGTSGVQQALKDLPGDDWPLPNLDEIVFQSDAAPEPQSDEGVTLRLPDVAMQAGLAFQFVNRHPSVDDPFLIYHLNGGGIGVLDFDRDGWQDCYFAQAGGEPHDAQGSLANQLFRNLGGSRFDTVSQLSGTADKGFGQGVSVADLNQDGFPDLLVANIGISLWFRNQGDGTFVRQALAGSADNQGEWTTSIACGDLNGDALPEIVLVNYSNDPDAYRLPCQAGGDYCSPLRFRAAADRVLTVGSDGAITKWNNGWADDQALGHGFGALIANIDQEEGNEVFVVNDTDSNRYLRSAGNKTGAEFAMFDNASLFGLATGVRGNRQGCMGLAHGDFDRNGKMDFHVTNYWDQPSDLYLQQSGGIFQNATMGRGVGSPSIKRVGWGTQAADLDRDGWLDLAVLNGHVVDSYDGRTPYKMTPQLFRGHPDRFDPFVIDEEYWVRPSLGRTLAQLDWNRDGKVDMLANHLDAPVALLENQSDIGNWIRFELVGVDSARDAVGAELRIEVEGESWTGWVVGGDGFQCNNESVVDFGIGKNDSNVTVEVLWPSGSQQRLDELTVNQSYLIIEGQPDASAREN